MNVGFYHHTQAKLEGGTAWVPGHFGMLIQGLADRAGRVVLYGHSAPEIEHPDVALAEPTVRYVDLGPVRSAPARSLLPRRDLARFDPRADGVDVMIVQGPSPLLPHLVRASRGVHVAMLLGGDYGTWRPRSAFPWWRNTLIRTWVAYYRSRQKAVSQGLPVLLQNPTLASSVSSSARCAVVPLSSVSEDDLGPAEPIRDWTDGIGRTEPLRLIYAGRIVQEKGLFEAVDALKLLADRGVTATLDLVGWEEPSDPLVDRLISRASELGLDDRVRFLGYRPAGKELLDTYRSAHVFVLPTYGDSVPRAMQEAMAVGLPAVASNVGGIAHYLQDRHTAMLIEPRDPVPIADAVEELVNDAALRRSITGAGRDWARSYTNESSCDAIMQQLREWFDLDRATEPS